MDTWKRQNQDAHQRAANALARGLRTGTLIDDGIDPITATYTAALQCQCRFYSMGVEIDSPQHADYTTSQGCPIHDKREAALWGDSTLDDELARGDCDEPELDGEEPEEEIDDRLTGNALGQWGIHFAN